MSDTARGSVSDYTSIDVGEQQIWASIYRTIGDPAVAAEVIEYFDREVNMKPYCPALYLRAKQTLRRDHQKTLQAERIGGFVRWTGRSLVINPLDWIGQALRFSREVVLRCLPDTEPAVHRVKALAKSNKFAAAQAQFNQLDGQAAMNAPDPSLTKTA